MKNKEKSKSKIVGITPQSKLEADKTELTIEQNLNMKIPVKTYQEPARPYFSSPCMLSEIEDNQDILDCYF